MKNATSVAADFDTTALAPEVSVTRPPPQAQKSESARNPRFQPRIEGESGDLAPFVELLNRAKRNRKPNLAAGIEAALIRATLGKGSA